MQGQHRQFVGAAFQICPDDEENDKNGCVFWE